ncbi:MAG: hypothetical protein KTR14_07100 [Vampirovibrio sp.]|nr:hypothetical protein [Vampirovibrio sp.]
MNTPPLPDPVNLLSTQQHQAIYLMSSLLYHNLTFGDIAQRVGVDRKTLYRWRQDATFIAALDTARFSHMRLGVREIDRHIMTLARQGNMSAIRLYYKMFGYLNQRPVQDDSLDPETKAELIDLVLEDFTTPPLTPSYNQQWHEKYGSESPSDE